MDNPPVNLSVEDQFAVAKFNHMVDLLDGVEELRDLCKTVYLHKVTDKALMTEMLKSRWGMATPPALRID